MKEFSHVPDPELGLDAEVISMRNKIKSSFSSQGMLSSIQAEAYQSRVWFSVSFTPKTKDRSKDKARLQRCKYTYIVHFPGEPYFYVAGRLIPKEVGDAVTDCLDAKGFSAVPLSGGFKKDVERG